MTRLLRFALAASCALAAIGCSADDTPLTQVMVVVDSDMSDLGSVRVQVDGMGAPQTATAEDLDKRPLPRTLAVVYRGGPLGPITVTAEAYDGDTLLVSRKARFSFIRGRNLTLELVLERSCRDMTMCGSDRRTCIDGSCTSSDVDAKDLADWTGKIDRHRADAGESPDAGEDSGTGMGGGSGSGGESGAPSAGQGGRSTGGTGGVKPAAGSGGMPNMSTCSNCKFDATTTKPNGSLTCTDNACVLRCDAGWSDADLAFKNGCEKQDPTFTWKLSNIDPTSSQLKAAKVPAITIDCTSSLDLGSGALPASVQLCGTQVRPVLVPQSGGPDIVVLATQHLTVTSGEVFTFAGARPIAFVVYGDAEIEGQLDVSATGPTSGAGAGSSSDCTPGAGGPGMNGDRGGGGGGGGFGTAGGKGAGSTSGATGGPAGTASTNTTLVPLRGGCSGGVGGQGSNGSTAAAGAGGGAIQLSVAGRLHIGGVISAAGGGGRGHEAADDAGAGGGSGGAILLEATTLETAATAWLSANGGGGGEGGLLSSGGNAGSDGARTSASAASGGSGSSAGGNGAAGTTPATNALGCSLSFCPAASGGGGGGGLGRIVARSATCTLAGKASPAVTCMPH